MGASTEYTQANRPIRVETALGPDVLLLTGFSGAEAISQPYTFDLDLMSLQSDIEPEDVLRKPVLITVDRSESEPRYIHGVASRFAQLGTRDDLSFYRARIVPWLWFLGLSKESRVYQNMTAPAIIEQIFKDHGYTDYDIRLTGTYHERIYCVQYRETHLDFVSRLMEDEGIYYYFEHVEDKHILVLSDDNATSEASPGADTLEFVSDEEHAENVITQIERVHSVHAGTVTLWDYDYLQPNVKLAEKVGDQDEEVYDYPGYFTDSGAGIVRAGTLWEGELAEEAVVRGASNAPGLTAGYNFTLKHHYRRDTNITYLLTEVRHSAHMGGFRGWGDGMGLDYRVEFLAIPNETAYVPPRRTPRPVMWSSQTAIVVGPKGEEVHVDKYGRIKVQFYWDREGKRDENSSCWVRVAMPWAGKGYGSVSIPRIGNEVVVAFEEGDPDKPLVIGSVYNALQMPPFGLPGAGIQMGMKSRSSPGGGGDNEITMTDTKGKEMINIHAQYDMVTTVEHDDTQTVRTGKQGVTVKGDASLTVQSGNRTVTVSSGNYSATAAKQASLHGQAEGLSVVGEGKGATMKGIGGKGVVIYGEPNVDIGAKTKAALHSPDTTVAGDDKCLVGSKALSLHGTTTLEIVGPDIKVGDKEISITGTKVTISGPAGSITLDASGVTISGAIVKIN